MNEDKIKIRFTGKGLYFLSHKDGGLLSLGECKTRSKLVAAVAECVAIGSTEDDCDWTKWEAAK